MIARREDEAEVLAYFDASPDETIWLRIDWQAHQQLAFSRTAGRITAVASHTDAGFVQVHGGAGLSDAVKEVARSDVKVRAIGGPPAAMRAGVEALGLGTRPVAKESREVIMALALDDLVLPELLTQKGVVSRRAQRMDVPQLIDWRSRYFREVHHAVPNERAIAEVAEAQQLGRLWVLEVDGELVNTAAFSAVFPKLVQIEYAWGPPELRAKKYGRSAAAGALAAVKLEGITRAVFNTHETNVAVQTGIQPIGFRKTGEYHGLKFVDE
jgi:predicted GNAT family acetyltransferase